MPPIETDANIYIADLESELADNAGDNLRSPAQDDKPTGSQSADVIDVNTDGSSSGDSDRDGGESARDDDV